MRPTTGSALAWALAVVAAAAVGEPPVGLWCARRHFGPELTGALTLEQTAAGWRAEIDGLEAPVPQQADRLSFELPHAQGAFRGRVQSGRIVGHWIQPPTLTSGVAYATPVTLERVREGRWRGRIDPLDDVMTFYLPLRRQPDGRLGAFLINPERNAGRFIGAEHAVVADGALKLLGHSSKDGPEVTLAAGPYDGEDGTFSLPLRGATYEFRRADAADEARFLPRPRAAWTYRPPPLEDDGWRVGTLEDAGLDRGAVTRFVQRLADTAIDSVHAPQVHGVLVARHGRLVLEEYFHGFHREALHDTRSASKSLTSVLTGAAILHGAPISSGTAVYPLMAGSPAPGRLDRRKRSLTVENLLTMTSGLDCDDGDPASPGNEDTMQQQTAQPDWYRYVLDLKPVRNPGESAVYCSGTANLLGGVLARATGRWLPELFRELVAEPLQMRRYAINLTPTGDAYTGGGTYLLARDFIKLGQLMLDGGRWNGRRVVSAEWARRSIAPLHELGRYRYGYLWWVTDYPFRGRSVRAFFAGGNGGQVVVGVPELDLVIAFFAGNYSDPVFYRLQQVEVPEYVLPAVRDR